MAMPEMGAIAEEYKDCLEVVSITTDGDEQWREAQASMRTMSRVVFPIMF